MDEEERKKNDELCNLAEAGDFKQLETKLRKWPHLVDARSRGNL